MRKVLTLLLLMIWIPSGFSNEVLIKTQTKVVVREHPKTGDSYVSIISLDEAPRQDLLSTEDVPYPRPDYKMLESEVKARDVEYEGPYSSRKKVYILAGSLAAMGVAGGLLPVTSVSGAAAGGSGLAAGASAGVATASGATAMAMMRKQDNLPEDYQRIQETELLEASDFYRIHLQKES